MADQSTGSVRHGGGPGPHARQFDRPGPALAAVLVLGLAAACAGAPLASPMLAATATVAPTATPEAWQLIWQDEFDGPAIDAANWTYDIGGGGWGNGELQRYTNRPENARVEDGLLVIEARQEALAGSQYTSARLKTQGLQEFQYGRIEGRFKVPSGAGLWPAFWTLGESFNGRNWPDCGEIDIMEHVGREPDLIMGTVHGPGYAGAQGLTRWSRQPHNIADDFHTFAIEWEAERISWFYDGVKYHTVTRADVGDRRWVFDQPFFFILNVAVGGQLGGMVSPETVFPAQLLVDYVRVYQSTRTIP